MLTRLRWLACFALLASLLLSPGCPNPNTKGPSMVTVIQLGSPPPDTTTNSIDLNAADVTRSQIPSRISIRLISNITTPSGAPLTSIVVTSRLDWQCSFGHNSQTIGTPQNAPLAFTPAIPTSSSSTSLKIDSVVDP